MSKIGAAVIEAEERDSEAFHEAMNEWDMEKLSRIVFRKETRNGKSCLVNVKD